MMQHLVMLIVIHIANILQNIFNLNILYMEDHLVFMVLMYCFIGKYNKNLVEHGYYVIISFILIVIASFSIGSVTQLPNNKLFSENLIFLIGYGVYTYYFAITSLLGLKHCNVIVCCISFQYILAIINMLWSFSTIDITTIRSIDVLYYASLYGSVIINSSTILLIQNFVFTRGEKTSIVFTGCTILNIILFICMTLMLCVYSAYSEEIYKLYRIGEKVGHILGMISTISLSCCAKRYKRRLSHIVMLVLASIFGGSIISILYLLIALDEDRCFLQNTLITVSALSSIVYMYYRDISLGGISVFFLFILVINCILRCFSRFPNSE
ncbi:MAG: hypothetical protein P857_38 [Candidatus Xenolissoclinum pacificiensis L6]|uniref:Uncharacterized protein n=1 Tax=Candidatus Xenolissoclinum pacificiensis L6 TaxID=1401685 RepID=W2V0F6_9RICK|nr:MAG: hypothetical protein P857_38 [Candidatus Xenolissoclinum pacificiensis L6]